MVATAAGAEAALTVGACGSEPGALTELTLTAMAAVDDEEVARWFRKLAAQGDSMTIYTLKTLEAAGVIAATPDATIATSDYANAPTAAAAAPVLAMFTAYICSRCNKTDGASLLCNSSARSCGTALGSARRHTARPRRAATRRCTKC